MVSERQSLRHLSNPDAGAAIVQTQLQPVRKKYITQINRKPKSYNVLVSEPYSM